MKESTEADTSLGSDLNRRVLYRVLLSVEWAGGLTSEFPQNLAETRSGNEDFCHKCEHLLAQVTMSHVAQEIVLLSVSLVP